MAPFQSDSQRPWKEYYALRNRARLGLLTTTICLYLFVVKPPSTLLDRLNNLPDALKLTVVLAGIGLVTIVVAAPVLKWAEWRCPRCGNKFAHPKTEFGGSSFFFTQLGGLYRDGAVRRADFPVGLI